jgi:hypothetical protein
VFGRYTGSQDAYVALALDFDEPHCIFSVECFSGSERKQIRSKIVFFLNAKQNSPLQFFVTILRSATVIGRFAEKGREGEYIDGWKVIRICLGKFHV